MSDTYKTFKFGGKTYGRLYSKCTSPISNTPFEVNGFLYKTEEFEGCLFRIRYDMFKHDTELPFMAIIYTNHPVPEDATKDLEEYSKDRVKQLVIQHVNDIKAEDHELLLVEMERNVWRTYQEVADTLNERNTHGNQWTPNTVNEWIYEHAPHLNGKFRT